MRAMGISFSKPWVSHPTVDRGTYINPYRSANRFGANSGWATQIVGAPGHQTEPSSLLGGAVQGMNYYGEEDRFYGRRGLAQKFGMLRDPRETAAALARIRGRKKKDKREKER